MNSIEGYLNEKLQQRKEAGNLRSLTSIHSPVDFFSNDYLGLATNKVIAKTLSGYPTEKLNTGSTGSRLLSGNTALAEMLETYLASFHHAEAALLFNSGYDANTGLLACIANRHTTILYDELCHASLLDGIRLSQAAKKYKFSHNNINELEQKLAIAQEPVIVVVESVYSMDGDMAPLNIIAAITAKYNAALIVDEAHATGVFGKKGEGLVCQLGLEAKVFARVHTFGKALGCHGAAIVGSTLLKQYLINFARTFIYTTALPPHTLYSIQAAYQYLANPGFTNKQLHDLIIHFRNKTEASGDTRWKSSNSPIQALITGSNNKTKAIATALQKAGMQVNPILHPTVAEGQGRLRICLHSFNTTEEIDHLFKTINEYICSIE
jgi:8-amino-7-oxononanoate synthase